MSIVPLHFIDPPESNDPSTPTRQDIADTLTARSGEWAIVARVDRAARAASLVARINEGREYGSGYSATARVVGNEHRVYARKG